MTRRKFLAAMGGALVSVSSLVWGACGQVLKLAGTIGEPTAYQVLELFKRAQAQCAEAMQQDLEANFWGAPASPSPPAGLAYWVRDSVTWTVELENGA